MVLRYLDQDAIRIIRWRSCKHLLGPFFFVPRFGASDVLSALGWSFGVTQSRKLPFMLLPLAHIPSGLLLRLESNRVLIFSDLS